MKESDMLTNTLRDHPITDEPLIVLRKFEQIREQGITFGCFFLFCTQPTLLTTIDAGRFDSETLIKDNLTIRDDLFSELDQVLDFVMVFNTTLRLFNTTVKNGEIGHTE